MINSFIYYGLSTYFILFFSWLFFCFLIDFVANNILFIKNSKIQSNLKFDNKELRSLAKKIVFKNWIIIFITVLFSSPLLENLFPYYSQLNNPIYFTELLSFLFFWFVINDLFFTIFHTLFHEIPFLYKHVHKTHHIWKAPFTWMSHAMTPYELLANSISLMIYPMYYRFYVKVIPIELIWFIFVYSQLIGCIEHSGYNNIYPLLIINPNKFPKWLFSTTKHHDDHHRYFKGNYGGYLAVWDYLMGTVILKNKN